MNPKQEETTKNMCRVSAALSTLRDLGRPALKEKKIELSSFPMLPETSLERREQAQSLNSKPETILYLAYGSNLCNETFRGKRGIKPISQINVQIPELRLTFDLPGIAYSEPCFANTARRDPEKDVVPHRTLPEKSDMPPCTTDYHKDRWHKGLIGVVYEVTPTDYAHIIATEGGGSSYHDIQVSCHPFASSNPNTPIPSFPTTPPFKAHTLFAPATPPGTQPPPSGGRFQRPNTSYSQPSPRYLKLITDGANECSLPYEYQDYLHNLRPYTITSNKQLLGQYIFLAIWLPFIMLVFALQGIYCDEKGRAPPWLKVLSESIFKSSWGLYDGVFKDTFGDGERTVKPKDGHDEVPPPRGLVSKQVVVDMEKYSDDV